MIKSTPKQYIEYTRRFACFSFCTSPPVEIYNPNGDKRVVVTKLLPGTRWLDILTQSNIRIEVCISNDTILSVESIKKLIGSSCHGVIGQLTENWSDELFSTLKNAGGLAYSNYAVGYNNVNVRDATKYGIPVGNTPAVLTDTTAELAAALTLSAARRVVESDKFMRGGYYKGWLPNLFIGSLLQKKTVGIIGAGRIGTSYARMMCEGHKMNVIYFDICANDNLEQYIESYCKLLQEHGEDGVTCRRANTVEEVLEQAHVVSLHCILDESTKHLINSKRLNLMKKDAILINTTRGPVIDEKALVRHLQQNPDFRCGLDVYEDEPLIANGLEMCENAVILPHIASASMWTRSGMATLAAANVANLILKNPVWNRFDMLPFIEGPLSDIPAAAPSVVNAAELGLPLLR